MGNMNQCSFIPSEKFVFILEGVLFLFFCETAGRVQSRIGGNRDWNAPAVVEQQKAQFWKELSQFFVLHNYYSIIFSSGQLGREIGFFSFITVLSL